MRILLVNYELPPLGGGAGNATHHIARGLAALGDEVLVVTSRFRGLPARERRAGYAIRRVPALRRRADRSTPVEMASFAALGLAPALAAARRLRPDAACAFFAVPSGPVAAAVRLACGAPYLVSLRGGDVPGFLPGDLGRFHRLAAPVIRAVWRGSAGLVANSDGLAALAARSSPRVPVHVVPNGVDAERFRPPERVRPAAPLRLLSVGRLVRQKGLVHVLDALARVAAPVELRIVGDGPERPALERRARELGPGARVSFAGWAERDALPEHYAWADAFVLASFEEGMANALLEALAAGLAAVASDTYGNLELVADGENGLLVRAGDPGSIAGAVAALAADPERLRALGRAARARALARGWDAVARRYRELLAAACAARAGAPAAPGEPGAPPGGARP